MLQPKKTKYRKRQRGKNRGIAYRGSSVAFGEYGLQCLSWGWITARQIEAARVAMTRFVKRTGKVWIRIFPDKPITRKPQETRMGKGKGQPEGYVCVVKPGMVLYEMEGIDAVTAERAMRLAADKLPVRTKLVRRTDDLTTHRVRKAKKVEQHG